MGVSPTESASPIEEKIYQIQEEANALRTSEEEQASEQETLAELNSSGYLLEQFLEDIEEVLKQVYVAGLAYPDPELSDELETLCERARTFRLANALEFMGKLRLWVQAIEKENARETRLALSKNAWKESQSLLAWLRMFRAQYNFLAVQGNLVTQSTKTLKTNSKRFFTKTLSAWPLGMKLAPDGKLLLYCQDVESHQTVFLYDQLAEFSNDHLLDHSSISRLFQDKIPLQKILSSLIRLEEHPVVMSQKASHFRPAFDKIPTLLGIASNFQPPPLLEFEEIKSAKNHRGPLRLVSKVRLQQGSFHFQDKRKKPLSLQMTSTLRFNLTKLLAREGNQEIFLDLVVWPEEDFLVLNQTNSLGERVFPGYDPKLFRFSENFLQNKITSEEKRLSAVEFALLKTALSILFGLSQKDLARWKKTLPTIKFQNLKELYRLGFACFLLDISLPEASVKPLVGALLDLKTSSPDVETLALLLGRPVEKISPVDIREVDSVLVYRALWLIQTHNLIEAFKEQLKKLFEDFYKKPPKKPSIADILTRTLLLKILSIETEEETKTEDKTLRFFEAYLEDLRYRRGKSKVLSLPEPIELLQFADTFALLTNANRRGTTLPPLELPLERIRQQCADALFFWLSSKEDENTSFAVKAADAMLVIAAANLRAYFIV